MKEKNSASVSWPVPPDHNPPSTFTQIAFYNILFKRKKSKKKKALFLWRAWVKSKAVQWFTERRPAGRLNSKQPCFLTVRWPRAARLSLLDFFVCFFRPQPPKKMADRQYSQDPQLRPRISTRACLSAGEKVAASVGPAGREWPS